MIIKCEKCQTIFKLPEEKVRPEGTKVRCSKCKHVFTIFSSREDKPVNHVEGFDEKTRIGFVHAPFGDDKDDDSPIFVKRHTETIPSSIESLGHGIPLSSPEIKMIDDIDHGLNEIMSAIESGLNKQVITDENTQNDSKSESVSIQSNHLSGDREKSREALSALDMPDIDLLLNSISNINVPSSGSSSNPNTVTEDLPDLSVLLSAPAEYDSSGSFKSDEGVAQQDTSKPQISTKPPVTNIDSKSQVISKESTNNSQDKLLLDIDKVFDSLFSEPDPVIPKNETALQDKQPRKTMLYMESVPIAQNNAAQRNMDMSTTLQPPKTEVLSQSEIPMLDKSSQQSQVLDNLLNEDLSLFFASQSQESQKSQGLSQQDINIGVLSDISLPVSSGEHFISGQQLKDIQSDVGGTLGFGELGTDLLSQENESNQLKFSPNANRSDDLLAQMDSIDAMAESISRDQKQANIPKSQSLFKTDQEEPIQTYNEAKDNVIKKSLSSVPIKPATMALRDDVKSIKADIPKWLFTVALGLVVIYTSYSPSKILSSNKTNPIELFKNPLVGNTISVDSFYFKRLNSEDTLVILSGYITLRRPVPPDEIVLKFRIADLSGTEITQVDYPLVYSDKYDEVMSISDMEGLKKFLVANKQKVVIKRKNPFIAPIILRNVDVNTIDIRSSLKISSK
ncbi:MAG: zinc-ribbon domain-containing protein [Deltaproteobacteria bacterium]|nr:zinc-ribbon domain-containing protein [Deltaproteobacteria bacterium]